jgi:heat shock protein HtpX
VYERIAQNRHKAWWVVILAILALVPFVAAVSYGAAAVVVHTQRFVLELDRDEKYLQKNPFEYREQFEQRPDDFRKRYEAEREADQRLTIEVRYAAAVAVSASLCILLWGMASSPVSKFLTQVGAQPAGEREVEARRMLESLAIGAGLPAPKLYVMETATPNAFAAGPDPQRAVISVTRGALNLFDRRELEGVLAHELSHIGNEDIRLNTIVAVIALFLRIPYLLFQRDRRSQYGRGQFGIGIWELTLTPLGIYILVIGPAIAACLRAAVSRGREFLADADAALLTRYPEGLMRALAKVGGAGSAMAHLNPAFSHFYFANPGEASVSWFSANLLNTHPPLGKRIERLLEFQGATGIPGLEEAIQEGRRYAEQRMGAETADSQPPGSTDELTVLNQGNPHGRVYRLVSSEPVAIYPTPQPSRATVAHVSPGELIVVFDDPGKFRQVHLADWTVGYIDSAVDLLPMNDMIPAEVYDAKSRAAIEAALPAARAAVAAPRPTGGLTIRQMVIAVALALAVFAGVYFLLMKSG